MCGRYVLKKTWVRDLAGLRLVTEKVYLDNDHLDVRPTHLMPIVRWVDGGPHTEMRRWGFLRWMPGKTPGKLVKRTVVNAMSETVMVKPMFKNAFANARCLIPMSAWYEWPVRSGKKQKIIIAPKSGYTMMAAGIYETSKDPVTGEPVDTFTMLTTTPTEHLGEVHDCAPLIMLPQHYEDWIAGDAAQAQALLDVHPGSDEFEFHDKSENFLNRKYIALETFGAYTANKIVEIVDGEESIVRHCVTGPNGYEKSRDGKTSAIAFAAELDEEARAQQHLSDDEGGATARRSKPL